MGCERIPLIAALAVLTAKRHNKLLCMQCLSGSVRAVGEMQSCSQRTKGDAGANEENHAQAVPVRDPAQRWTSDRHRDIEKDRVDAHRQPTIFR